MHSIINIFITFLGFYTLIGFVFAIYFFILGAKRLDPLIKDSSFWVRLLLVPGSIGLWWFLLIKIIKKKNGVK